MDRRPAPPKHGVAEPGSPHMESAACSAADNDVIGKFAEAILLFSGETAPESTFLYVGAEFAFTWRLVVVAVLTRFRRNRLLGET